MKAWTRRFAVLAVSCELAALAVATPALAAAPHGEITTIVGGVGGPAPAPTVSIGEPCGLTWSPRGLLIGTNAGTLGGGVVRSVSTTSGQLTNLVGSGAPGFSPDGTRAPYANATSICDAIDDHHGNVVFSDSSVSEPDGATFGNELIGVAAGSSGVFYGRSMRKGLTYTIAGNGTFGFSGDGGSATDAELGIPLGLAVDAAGNIVFATAFPTGHIRVIAAQTGTFYGQLMRAGDIYTIAGGSASATCASSASDGQPATGVQLGLDPWLAGSTVRQFPDGLRIDQSGNVVFVDSGCDGQSTVQVVAAQTGAFYGQSMQLGSIYTIAGGGTADPGTGGLATSAVFDHPGGLAIDHSGNVVVAVTGLSAVEVIAVRSGLFYGRQLVAGHLYSLAGGNGPGSAGDGGPARQARLDSPSAVAVDGQGNVVIADAGGMRVRLVAARSGTFYGTKMRTGDIYTIAGNGVPSFSGDGGPASRSRLAGIGESAEDVAADPAGDLVIADQGTGHVRFVPARSGPFFGRHLTARHIYDVAGRSPARLEPYNCDGGTESWAGSRPCWVAFDHAGNALVASETTLSVIPRRTGHSYGQAMKAGRRYLIAGGGSHSADGTPSRQARLRPRVIAVDAFGNIVLTSGGRLRVIAESTGTFYGLVMRAGRFYTVAPNFFLQAVDAHGNLIGTNGFGFGDTRPGRKNQVLVLAARKGVFYGRPMTPGHAYVVAGTGLSRESGDDGPAAAAGMVPASVAVDGSGNLVISDGGNTAPLTSEPVIRVVAESTGAFYGRRMTRGHIYRVAGGGSSQANDVSGFDAQLFNPPLVLGVADGALVAEGDLGVIRLIRS